MNYNPWINTFFSGPLCIFLRAFFIILQQIFKVEPTTSIKSCKDVQQRCPECRSGIYTLQFAEPTRAYCDMETENGKKIIFLNPRETVHAFTGLQWNVY